MRKLRAVRGWTQADLAPRAQVHRNYHSLIELGRSSPSMALDVRATNVLADVERRV